MSREMVADWRVRPLTAQLLRFAIVGLFATGIYLSSVTLLSRRLELSVPLAATISFIMVSTTNYLLHYFWTFRSRRHHGSAVPRFLGTSLGGMAINYAIVALGTRWLLLSRTGILFLGIAFVVLWNYALSKFWVFVDSHSGDP
jgi:putative flippase GtrA